MRIKHRGDIHKGHWCNKAGHFNMYDLAGFLEKQNPLTLCHKLTPMIFFIYTVTRAEYLQIFINFNF